MKSKILHYFLLFSLFTSCAPKINLTQTPLSNGLLKIIPVSYIETNYVTPIGKKLVTMDLIFLNYSENIILFDADELFLIDKNSQEYRVESISGIRHDDNGKIFWNIKGNSKFEKKVEFIIGENVEPLGLRYGNKQIKLSPTLAIIHFGFRLHQS